MKKEEQVLICIIVFVVVLGLAILYNKKESYDPTNSTYKQCMESCDVHSYSPSSRDACRSDCSMDNTYKTCIRTYGHVPYCERLLTESYIDLCKLYPENCNQYY